MRALALALAATPIAADPLFEDHSDALPHHVYNGDWTHFVGGGVAVFDCNGDGRAEIFAAGGESPARLFLNETRAPGAPLTFRLGKLPEMTAVTGAS